MWENSAHCGQHSSLGLAPDYIWVEKVTWAVATPASECRCGVTRCFILLLPWLWVPTSGGSQPPVIPILGDLPLASTSTFVQEVHINPCRHTCIKVNQSIIFLLREDYLLSTYHLGRYLLHILYHSYYSSNPVWLLLLLFPMPQRGKGDLEHKSNLQKKKCPKTRNPSAR